MIAVCEVADHNDQDRPGPYSCRRHSVFHELEADQCTGNCSSCINVFRKDIRFLVGKDIPQQSASHTGQRPAEHTEKPEIGTVRIECMPYADDRKDAESQCIRPEKNALVQDALSERSMTAAEIVVDDEHDQRHKKSEEHIRRILECPWWNMTKEQIAKIENRDERRAAIAANLDLYN